MGFWYFFFGKRPQIEDGFFGTMLFMEDSKDPAKSYFECQRYFRPSGENIGLSVTGPLSGPTQRQKDFFNQVETNYPLLVDKLMPIIEERFGAWMPLPVIKAFAREFKLGYFLIPTREEQPMAWEITFDTVHDLNHIVTVGMLDYEPQYVRIDG
ncbi:MAG: hypothetical protein EOO37_05850 [Cytophagaceae bacterium]|nr:MAG: hypothetical protein EOO37_05850 [Cytophagaceae bacterium]